MTMRPEYIERRLNEIEAKLDEILASLPMTAERQRAIAARTFGVCCDRSQLEHFRLTVDGPDLGHNFEPKPPILTSAI